MQLIRLLTSLSERLKKIITDLLRLSTFRNKNKYLQSGAHFVIETTNDLPEVIAEINKRMQMGLKP